MKKQYPLVIVWLLFIVDLNWILLREDIVNVATFVFFIVIVEIFAALMLSVVEGLVLVHCRRNISLVKSI